MRDSSRFILSTIVAAGLLASIPATPASAFTSAEQKCRAAVSKSGDKYVKTALKAMTTCHKNRDADGGSTNCNDIQAADEALKVPVAADKFESTVLAKCPSINPNDVMYESCPAPCSATVPSITTFTNVVDCLVCLADNNSETFSTAANGNPNAPLTNEAEAACHASILKNGSKFYNNILKAVTKCQSKAEKDGVTEGLSGCENAGDTAELYAKCFEPIQDACAEITIPNANLGACANNITMFDVVSCVCDSARASAENLAPNFFVLDAPVITTTTTTTTTTSTTSTTNTTIPGVQDPQCPNMGELTLYAHDSQIVCDDNADCAAPRTCDTAIGYCTTVADLDSGWTGTAHNSDINDGITTKASLVCPGPSEGGCGECQIGGIDPEPGNCRCTNNVRTICDDPFSNSSNDCPTCAGGAAVAGVACTSNTDCNFPTCTGRCSVNLSITCTTNANCTAVPGAGSVCSTSAAANPSKKCGNGKFCSANADCVGTCSAQAGCECFFGAPFPLNSGGTAACIVNRFANDISGTANVDLGAGDITANLRTRVYLGITQQRPCPVCAGKCSHNNALCLFSTSCGAGNTCIYDVPNDGIRNGLCNGGLNSNQSCDASAFNATFPAISTGGVPTLPGGGWYSIDCQPSVGINVSGTGLAINLEQTTGMTTLDANLDCNGANPGTDLCPCMQCTKDKFQSCTADSECASQGSFCSLYNDPTTFSCDDNSDCAAVDTGLCTASSNTACSNAVNRTCSSNADCGLKPGGSCIISTCAGSGLGGFPQPNKCNGGVCQDIGGGNGQCATGPDQGYCDGLLRIDGRGIQACGSNADCTSVNFGACTLSERQLCFLDPIVAQGDPDPVFPVAGSVFCIPPTENSSINSVAGLPGPGRVISQGLAKTYCASNNAVQYTPGGAPACP